MVKERINELVDFATIESPYKSANQGWITPDIFLKWGKSEKASINAKEQLANISVYWKPINQIVVMLFLVFFLASIFFFSALSLAQGKVHLASNNSGNTSEIEQIKPSPVKAETSKTNTAKQSSITQKTKQSSPQAKEIANEPTTISTNVEALQEQASANIQKPKIMSQPSKTSIALSPKPSNVKDTRPVMQLKSGLTMLTR